MRTNLFAGIGIGLGIGIGMGIGIGVCIGQARLGTPRNLSPALAADDTRLDPHPSMNHTLICTSFLDLLLILRTCHVTLILSQA